MNSISDTDLYATSLSRDLLNDVGDTNSSIRSVFPIFDSCNRGGTKDLERFSRFCMWMYVEANCCQIAG